MKFLNLRFIVFVSFFLFMGQGIIGQIQIQPIQNSSTAEKCAATIVHDKMMQSSPAYVQRMEDFEKYVLLQSTTNSPRAAAQYRIPVVVHVIHKGEAIGTGSNVSDEDIEKAIRNMNERYRRTLPGLDGVDLGVEFALAVRSPSNQCTNGITRVDMSSYSNASVRNTYLNFGVEAASADGITDAELKAITSWDRSKYYNIYLVSEFDDNGGGFGVQGYAYTANAHGFSVDGAAILANNFTNDFTMTTTHELGHALNLLHTFEGDNNGNSCPPAGANQGDMCGDIPPHIRSASNCNSNGTNSCDGGSSNSLFVHNYMDYAADDCVNMFTADQRTRALAACSGPRASFFYASNLALVPVSAPTAEFNASASIICSGEAVNFYDQTDCVPNTYLEETSFPNITFDWTFTNGTVTLTSTDQNPVMNFTSPGAYDVTLTITSPAGTSTITKQSFIILGGTLVNACSPNIGQSGNFGQTVSNIKFNSINSSTSSITNSYEDLSCSFNTVVDAGATYPISVSANGATYDEAFEVYIDFNNDGVFSNPSELIFSGIIPDNGGFVNPQTLTGNVTIPSGAVTNTFLRMRVMADAESISAGNRNCSTSFSVGDIQDYGVYIKSACAGPPTITTQPTAKTICSTGNTTFNIAASNATSYQWQVSTNGGSTWSNLSNGGVYSSVTSATLTITNATASMNNYRYRCVSSNGCGPNNSNTGILTVNASPTVASTTPNSRCGTGTVVLNATTSTGTLSWYSNASGGSALGTGTSFTTPSIASSRTYYVGVSNAGCVSSRTAVTATINKNVELTSNPSNPIICAGEAITLTASNGSAFSWSNGGTGNSINVSPAVTTVYTVTGTSPCVNTAAITVTVEPCLGVDENDLEDLLVIYPNPTRDWISIEGKDLIDYQNIELRDVTGRLILVQEVSSSKMNIDLSRLENGNYIIYFFGVDKQIARKIQVVK